MIKIQASLYPYGQIRNKVIKQESTQTWYCQKKNASSLLKKTTNESCDDVGKMHTMESTLLTFSQVSLLWTAKIFLGNGQKSDIQE